MNCRSLEGFPESSAAKITSVRVFTSGQSGQYYVHGILAGTNLGDIIAFVLHESIWAKEPERRNTLRNQMKSLQTLMFERFQIKRVTIKR